MQNDDITRRDFVTSVAAGIAAAAGADLNAQQRAWSKLLALYKAGLG